ncbi:MAG TPA: glucose 1-dehydrogenase [Acidimicrobiales bacterium]|nr:glucose 1-dehydrogenase [Acidimicrobiales bacterium]
MPTLSQAFDLHGKVAAVTGGASGIGQATATVLAEVGAAVVVADIDLAGAQQTVTTIEKDGGQAAAIAVDTRHRRDLDAAVDAAVARFGGLDIMCNIAGVPSDGPMADVPEEEVDRIIGINVKGVLFGCQAALPAMKARGGGAIVNVSSTGIDVARFGNGLYAMSKAAVAMMSMALAAEYGPHGIRVNAIAPGATITKFTERHFYDEAGNRDEARFAEFVDRMKEFSPLGIVGEAMDQALLILYLVSPAAKYATGNIFRVNGGQSMVW